MIIQLKETRAEESERLYNWHDWFAWHPVTIDGGQILWLEHIQRVLISGYMDIRAEYRMIKTC